MTIPAAAGDPDPGRLLAAYDTHLRTDAETPGAIDVVRLGPLRLVTFPGGRGFVTYQDLGGADAATIRGFVASAMVHFAADDAVTRVEWKTRGHDVAPGLHDALVDHGFVPDDPESIMVGPAEGLAVDVPLPDDVTLRQITAEADVRAMSAMSDEVFGDDPETSHHAEQVLARQALDPQMELWVAEADGRIVGAGRLEPVAGTPFAGVWGGSTRPEWRGRGIYRALTAARARSALAAGKTLMHSDSTEFSRPILERSGLVKVSTTTPYEWKR
ncbi:GNAT family N-acetyltransferase [Isoptericola sp. NEAU-Y5]|uniref:GNAT family N-acetyltransferase n=1 Tax=Isoptericola luteus TaxID=2879484 RepID=A0ABS7ZBK6_9MICO|nr:GNAT family N-acetyltransferase [Isoptericola sp. NEAU-Y5]MCA5892410.1 GNAT family N-acetyltransferase [Isoptericola sp. NEAU-Y5]